MKNLIHQCDLADAAPQATTPQESEPLPALPVEKPKLSIEQRMFAGTGLADAGPDSDPNRDLRWLPADEWENARLLRMAWRDYESGVVPEIGAYDSDGNHVGTTAHDERPSPGSLTSPAPQTSSGDYVYDAESGTHKPAKKAPTGGVVRTSGAIGNHYH